MQQKQTYPIKTKWFEGTVFLRFQKYATNGATCLQLIDSSDGLVAMVPSVNITGIELEKNQIAVKSYTENEGVEQFLKENGIATDTGRYAYSGMMRIPIYELLIEVK